jgi:hypothetical protein
MLGLQSRGNELHFFTFVPTREILEKLGIESQGEWTAFDTGYVETEKPIEIIGASGERDEVQIFIFQYTPEEIVYQMTTNWSPREGVGSVKPVLQYGGMQLDRYPLKFVTSDHWNGPPLPFRDINSLLFWLKSLMMPIEALGRPPYIEVTAGNVTFRGVIETMEFRIVNMAANMRPQIAVVNCVLLEFPL